MDSSDAENDVQDNYISEMTNQEIQIKLLVFFLALVVILEAVHTFFDSSSPLTDENAQNVPVLNDYQ